MQELLDKWVGCEVECPYTIEADDVQVDEQSYEYVMKNLHHVLYFHYA